MFHDHLKFGGGKNLEKNDAKKINLEIYRGIILRVKRGNFCGGKCHNGKMLA